MFNVKVSVHQNKGGFKMKLKMIQVEENTHNEAKKKALSRGISLKEYIKQLVEKDK